MAEYLSNPLFTKAISEYREICLALPEDQHPEIPREIANNFIQIATRLASRPNFTGYSYKDEMISDALYTCCAKILKFDPEITQNAFAYFTQICWYAFLGVITKEKKEAYIKAKAFYMSPEDMFEYQEHDEADVIISEFIPYFDVEEFERKDQERKDKSKVAKIKESQGGVDLLMDLDVDLLEGTVEPDIPDLSEDGDV